VHTQAGAANEPRASKVAARGRVLLPGHGGQAAARGHLAKQASRRLVGRAGLQQPAGEDQHRHHRLGRRLRGQRAGHFGHLGQALAIAARCLGHQQPGPALRSEQVPEGKVESRRLTSQRAGTRSW
jgi:hypothetical protein